MVFNCGICSERLWDMSVYCVDCSVIRRIILTYGRSDTRQILERVCLRNKKQQDYKINDIIKESQVCLDDNSYVNPPNQTITITKKTKN